MSLIRFYKGRKRVASIGTWFELNNSKSGQSFRIQILIPKFWKQKKKVLEAAV